MEDKKPSGIPGTPMRQSPAGIVVEFVFALREAVKILWPLLVLMVLKPGKIPGAWAIAAGIVILVAIIIVGYLRFINFVFYTEAPSGDFVLESGIFNKKKIIIRPERIQQIEITQNFIQKLLNVFAIEINTASTAGSEIKIKAVSYETAIQLKEKLLKDAADRSAPAVDEVVPAQPASPRFYLSIKTLAKIAVTSNYGKSFAIIVASLAALYDALRDFLHRGAAEDFINRTFQVSSVFYATLFFTGIAFVFLFLFNLVRVLITFSGYRIAFRKKAFSISYGLFNTRNILLHPEKIQVVEIVTNSFQKRMDLRRIFLRQASSDISHDKQATVQIPGCTLQQQNELLQKIFREISPEKIRLTPNIRKLIPGTIFLVILPLAPVLFARGAEWYFVYVALLPFWLLAAGAILYFRFRNSRLKAGEGFVQVVSGAWDVTTQMLETYKIQAITTRQRLWHRKANVGHIVLHTAGGTVSFRYGDFNKLNMLADQWLYEIETSDKARM